LLVVLSYSLYAGYRLSRAGLLRPDEIRRALRTGAVPAVPGVLGARAAGKVLVRRFWRGGPKGGAANPSPGGRTQL
jgi:hypothetical protein